MVGMEDVDLWVMDVYKMLNVFYDCGMVIVCDFVDLIVVFCIGGDYFIYFGFDLWDVIFELF